MNEDGEGVFAGSIQTMKDCLIQGMLRVGMAGNNTKGIEFYGDSYQPDKDGNYSTPYARLVPYVANNEDYKGTPSALIRKASNISSCRTTTR